LSTIVLLASLLVAAPAATESRLLPTVDGWKLSAPPTTYSAETLFEYIDGGADAFLQFDFQELASAIYVNAAKVELTADVFRHRDPSRAFGIYSQERRPGSAKMPGPLEGIASSDHLEFVLGAYYVKLALPGGGDSAWLPMFAAKIAGTLPGRSELPAVLARFPKRGKKPRAEKLSARDFLGHAFLHDAAAVPYEIGGGRFRLFAIEGKDAADVLAMVAAFRVLAKLPKTEMSASGGATIKDPLNGDVQLAWSGRWLWGAVDEPSPVRAGLVDELGRNLAKK
jgi:hypothetical protein